MKATDEIDVLECKVRGLETECRHLRETLRDQFAIAALNGLISAKWGPEDMVTEHAWRIADLMMEVRGR